MTPIADSKVFPASGPTEGAPVDDDTLRESLKRCSPATYYAACKFRQTRAPECVPIIVGGLIERFVDRSVRAKLREPSADLRLAEDLGLDSLTMMEIVMLAEEVLVISINNDELRGLRTLGDIQQFIAVKLRGDSAPMRPAAAAQPAS